MDNIMPFKKREIGRKSEIEQIEEFIGLSPDDKKITKSLLFDIITHIGQIMINLDSQDPKSGQYFKKIIGSYTPGEFIKKTIIIFLRSRGWTVEFMGPQITLDGGCVMIVKKL